MIGALDLLADERIDLLVRLHLGARLQLAPAVAIESALGKDLARQAHAGAHLDPVVGLAQIIEADRGLLARIGRLEPDAAAALRAHRPHVRLKSVLLG